MAKRNTAPKPKEPEVVEQKVDEPEVTGQEQITGEVNETSNAAPEVKVKEVVQHVVTLGTVKHSGKVYQVGDKIDLPKSDLQRLIDLGVVKQV